MKIYYNKYKTLSGRQVCEKIINFFKEEGIPLSNEQQRILLRYWGEDIGMKGNLSLPFQAYEWTEQNNKNKNKIIHRLLFPVIFLILLIIRIIKWLFTGNMFFNTKNIFEDKVREYLKI